MRYLTVVDLFFYYYDTCNLNFSFFLFFNLFLAVLYCTYEMKASWVAASRLEDNGASSSILLGLASTPGRPDTGEIHGMI